MQVRTNSSVLESMSGGNSRSSNENFCAASCLMNPVGDAKRGERRRLCGACGPTGVGMLKSSATC